MKVNVTKGQADYPLWDKKFNYRTDFTGEIDVELVWVMYDDNDGYQEWNISTHPDRDKASGYKTRQVYMADIPEPLKEQGERSGVRTAEEVILSRDLGIIVNGSIGIKISEIQQLMKKYATQVAEAVRTQCSKVAYNEREPSLEILRINISDFIK